MLTNTRGYSLFVVLMLVATAPAMGQLYQPFADNHIHYDLQLFAPPVIEEYGNEPVAPNYGMYMQYSRAYMNLTRPDYVNTNFNGDFTYGNRIDVGYMSEDDHGWAFTSWKIQSPSVNQFVTVVDIEGDNVILSDSVNDGKFSGVELNKTFRLRPIQHGDNFSFLEPFFGVRWAKFTDFFVDEDLNVVFIDEENGFQQYDSVGGTLENNMIGGQIGARWYTRRGHWILSSEFRAFGLQNYQFQESTTFSQDTDLIDDVLFVDPPVVATQGANYNEFVVGGDLRVEVAYELTREIRARVGFNMMHFGTGIGRGPGGEGTNQDLTYAGVVVGLEINR